MLRILAALLLTLSIPLLAQKQVAVAKELSRFEQIAVEELMRFLPEISLKKYVLVSEEEAGEAAIYLGNTAFARKNGVEQDKLGREELVLKSVGEQLIICGGLPVGSLYAVYQFLQEQGLYFLSWDGTKTMPAKKEIKLSGYDMRKSPSINSRFIYDRVPMLLSQRRSPQKYIDQYQRYVLRNRSGGKQDSGQTGEYLVKHSNTSRHTFKWHSFFSYVNPKTHFENHPEYFSMNAQGERVPNQQLCLSNPEVARVATDSLRRYIKLDREELESIDWPLVYDITQMDNTKSFCECPICKAIVANEGHSGLLWKYFINPIAYAIAEEYPDVQIRSYAYSFSDKLPPPHIKPAPNTVVFYCNLYMRSDCYRPLTHPLNQKQLQLYEDWESFGAPILMWDYWNMGGMSFFNPPRIETCIDAIIGNVRRHKGHDGLFAEYEISHMAPQMFFALDNFIALQMMYDCEQDAEKLIEIFMRGYYGAAWRELYEAFSRIRQGVAAEERAQLSMRVMRWSFLSSEFLLELYQSLKKAESLVQDSPEDLRHVQTEMIVPLWEIVAKRRELQGIFTQAGFDMEQLKLECERLTLGYFEAYEAALPEGPGGRLTKEPLELLLAELETPEKFAAYSDQVLLFPGALASKKDSYYVMPRDDAHSPYKRASVFSHPDAEYHRKAALRFTVGGSTNKGRSMHIEPIPQDEQYHWYCIRDVGFSGRTWLDGWASSFVLFLSSAFKVPTGIEEPDFNHYDVWFSAKVTGPVYVDASEKPNEVFIDMVVLTKPGLLP